MAAGCMAPRRCQRTTGASGTDRRNRENLIRAGAAASLGEPLCAAAPLALRRDFSKMAALPAVIRACAGRCGLADRASAL